MEVIFFSLKIHVCILSCREMICGTMVKLLAFTIAFMLWEQRGFRERIEINQLPRGQNVK